MSNGRFRNRFIKFIKINSDPNLERKILVRQSLGIIIKVLSAEHRNLSFQVVKCMTMFDQTKPLSDAIIYDNAEQVSSTLSKDI